MFRFAEFVASKLPLHLGLGPIVGGHLAKKQTRLLIQHLLDRRTRKCRFRKRFDKTFNTFRRVNFFVP